MNNMKVDYYSFGSISINGTSYNADLIVFPNKIETNWWRLQGHLLQIADIRKIFDISPEVLIIGTGDYGYMKVSDDILEELEKRNIKYFVEKSSKAIEIFNSCKEKNKVLAIHLTC